ncbi:hypothetical protein EYF80_035143 [Liparis tanakae]|uniref:Uncharacterized protein n=1 Tax=Liparis tanakae TaxID=230148 RepID=A0A4Z2GN38_9TELE|nr:hypothetical protein EYF80_035143 [Liparis tanakae]
MCVVRGGRSSGEASSTKPRWSRVPLLEAGERGGRALWVALWVCCCTTWLAYWMYSPDVGYEGFRVMCPTFSDPSDGAFSATDTSK